MLDMKNKMALGCETGAYRQIVIFGVLEKLLLVYVAFLFLRLPCDSSKEICDGIPVSSYFISKREVLNQVSCYEYLHVNL